MSAWFYPIAWSLQLGFGLLLFAVAALLETLVLHAYLGEWWLALSLAAALEALKILVIVGHRILLGQGLVRYPHSVRWAAMGFRGLLLGLSAACSLMFLAGQLDRPAMAEVRAADLAAAGERHRADTAAARTAFAARRDAALADLEARAAAEREALAERHLPVIASLEEQLSAEMDVVVNGEFIGKRYRALQARLAEEKAAYDRARAALASTDAEHRAALLADLDADLTARLTQIDRARDTRVEQVRASDYQGDPRVEHPLARAFVNSLGAVVAEPPTVLAFVFYFALLLSLTVELGIWVSFEHVTLAHLPVFEARHRADVFAASKAVETASELRGFAMDTEQALAKARDRRRAIDDLLREEPVNGKRPGAADTGADPEPAPAH